MAGHAVAGGRLPQAGLLLPAALRGVAAAAGKGAALGLVGGAGHLSGEDDALPLPFDFGVGEGNAEISAWV